MPIQTSAPNAPQDSEEVRLLRENITSLTAQCAQLDEANHAWQLYQQTQLDNLRNKLMHHIPIEENMSLDEMVQQLADQITKEREDFHGRLQTVERANDQLRSGSFLCILDVTIRLVDFLVDSHDILETTKQSYGNTIDELNQELLEMKEAYNQLDAERHNLLNELEKQSLAAEQDRIRRMTGKFFSYISCEYVILDCFRESCITKHAKRTIQRGLSFCLFETWLNQ